jgi:Fe2+ transport system protein FeoA
MHCPLCNFEFDEQDMTCHMSCAFNRQCAVICCPNCGYQMVDESRTHIASWLRKRLGAKPKLTLVPADPSLSSVSALQPGQSATVVTVAGGDSNRQERLSMYGIMPGALITLRQRQPAFVLHIGFTELSLDRDVADSILVEPLAP